MLKIFQSICRGDFHLLKLRQQCLLSGIFWVKNTVAHSILTICTHFQSYVESATSVFGKNKRSLISSFNKYWSLLRVSCLKQGCSSQCKIFPNFPPISYLEKMQHTILNFARFLYRLTADSLFVNKVEKQREIQMPHTFMNFEFRSLFVPVNS